jgi:hypothetical protein
LPVDPAEIATKPSSEDQEPLMDGPLYLNLAMPDNLVRKIMNFVLTSLCPNQIGYSTVERAFDEMSVFASHIAQPFAGETPTAH